ncbi:MAG: DEAD/DEAH box helicase family protein [bacterium]
MCDKPKVKCGECPSQAFLPITDDVIRNHVLGFDPKRRSSRGQFLDFTVGVYPMLQDETCLFLAADFDRDAWTHNAEAFLQTCRDKNVPAALERSRSGNGGHVWIFFSEAVAASEARKLGTFLLTKTMESRPEIGLESYDRFFPNQDTMPTGGFGNLIALPFQRRPREHGNSLFLNDEFEPFDDQWAFLSSIRRMRSQELNVLVEEARREGQIIGVRMVLDEDGDEPWDAPPSRRTKGIVSKAALPKQVSVVLGNQVYIEKESLPPSLINRLVRLAAFQNPEFYRAQAMRFPTFGKPRIIACAEDFSKHIGLPRGCLDDVLDLFGFLGVNVDLQDRRNLGRPLETSFLGELGAEQNDAANALLLHDTGVLAAATAFGKTVIAAKLIASRGRNTLVLVHRRQLLDQWIARLVAFLDLESTQVGQIGGGKRKPTGIVDVALIQSLVKRGEVQDIVADYGHLIVDECHHLSAVSFESVARESKARYVLGLTATVTRKDGHHPIILMQCGPIRFRVDPRKQAESRPFDHRVTLRYTDFRMSLSSEDNGRISIHEIYRALAEDSQRNSLIVEDVLRALHKKRSPVVLTERREHVGVIAEKLSGTVRNVVVLQGGMSMRQRKDLVDKIASIPDHEERVLIATGRYLGEGFDDARLDTLFLAMPISWRGTLAQYAGRLHRLHYAKRDVIIYDYVDHAVPMLARMSEKRLRGYRSLGYEVDSPKTHMLF